MKRTRRRRLPWIPLLLLGFVAGAALQWWRLLPPGPFTPPLVGGLKPDQDFVRHEDQHHIRAWVVPGSVDSLVSELKEQLPASEGWQPPLLRNTNPETVQFARVHAPNGDFQFTRVVVTAVDAQKSNITIDEEPKQAHAFRR